MKIDCVKETKRIREFIRQVFSEAGFTKAVVGISGGIDSAVVATLLAKELGKNNVFGYMLPYGEQEDIVDSRLLMHSLKLNRSIINIKDMVDSIASITKPDMFRLGNIMARVRMIILYDKSAQHNAIVAGTGNRTELLLGYFTLHGDGACAIEPIGHLMKTQVRQLAKYLKVPKEIIDKAPSAGLWEGQTDEKELGMKYEDIDKMLLRVDNNLFKFQPPVIKN